MMPKVALLFAFLVFPLILTNSYALPFDELNSFDDFQNQIIFNSNIVDFDSNFFIENLHVVSLFSIDNL
jgi:hypothetical protein